VTTPVFGGAGVDTAAIQLNWAWGPPVNMLLGNAIFLIFSLAAPLGTVADEILGCGGFIKSHIPIEYSKVEVGL
jgi:hypothetical protein